MGLNPFGKKKKGRSEDYPGEAPYGPSQGMPRPPDRKIVPTDEVRALSSRGVSEPDIIRNLRREGYSTTEIDQAMKDALRSRVSGDFYNNRPVVNEYGEASLGPPPENAPSREELPRNLGYPISAGEDDDDLPPPPYEPQQGQQAQEPEYPEMPSGEYFEPVPQRRMPAPSRMLQRGGGIDRKEIEELAEVIVEEKVRELRERFKAVDMQFQQYSRKLDSVLDEISRMRNDKSGEIHGIESKIDNYNRSMEGVNARIESMEKALRDSLSPMLESLRSLADLVRSMKEKGK
jgi:hypothetical protein